MRPYGLEADLEQVPRSQVMQMARKALTHSCHLAGQRCIILLPLLDLLLVSEVQSIKLLLLLR